MKKYIRNIPKDITLSSEFDKLKAEMTANSLSTLSNKRANYFKSKKKRVSNQKKLKRIKKQRLEDFSKQLELSLPKSEVWFRDKYLKEDLPRKFNISYFQDQFNKPFNCFIPDVHNRGYRYIIEVDGSWHDRPDAQLKDIKRNYYFKKRGYLMIRVKDHDEESYKHAIELIKARIIEIDELETKKRNL